MSTDTVITVLVTSAFVACLGFVVRYAKVRWYASTAGQLTMSLFASLVLVFGLVTLGAYTDNDYAYRPGIRIAAYAVINVLLWRALFLLITDQRRGRGK